MAHEKPYSIRLATCDDVEDIYAIKAQSFSNYLHYTIYYSPFSVKYLRNLICQGEGKTLFAVCQGHEVLGYYHGVLRDTDFFLNYIAVRSEARGQGVGQVLLKHYEDVGRTYGYQRLALDVFDTNRYALDWYLDQGYQVSSFNFTSCLDLSALNNSCANLQLSWNTDDWHRACEEESWQGFSKIDAVCGDGNLTIGLVANCICRLLHYENMELEMAILSIAQKFRGDRDWLIVSSLPAVPVEWPVLTSEKVLSLHKFI